MIILRDLNHKDIKYTKTQINKLFDKICYQNSKKVWWMQYKDLSKELNIKLQEMVNGESTYCFKAFTKKQAREEFYNNIENMSFARKNG